MPDLITTRRDDRPTEGYTTTFLPSAPNRPVRLYLPADYQPKYAYPLVVLFHSSGTDEDAAARLVPGLSRRNYIAACPRGPVRVGFGPTGRANFAWSSSDPKADHYLREMMIHVCTEYHVHSDRVYLVGVGEGAVVAYRLGMAMSRSVAGVAALSSRLPASGGRVRGLRVFIGHGTHNPEVPISTARATYRRLAATGADVRFTSYPTTHRVNPDMLRDVNRWIMSAVTTEPETPAVG